MIGASGLKGSELVWTSEKGMTKRVCNSDVEGRRDRSRPCVSFSNAVKNARNARSLELRDANVNCMVTG